MNYFKYYILLLSLFFYGCPPGDKPPVDEQQDIIEWPSLSDQSPWPMHRHDAQNTGRSPNIGPTQLTTTIQYPYSGFQDGDASMLNDSTLLVTSIYEGNALYAITQSGNELWHTSFSERSMTAPLVLSDGTMIATGTDGKVVKLNQDGTILWSSQVQGNIWSTDMTIDLDGNMYVYSDGPMISKISGETGNIMWTLNDGYSILSSFAFSPDGLFLYAVSPSPEMNLMCIDISTGNVSWRYEYNPTDHDATDGKYASAPIVESNGSIYWGVVGNASESEPATIFKLSPDGTEEWIYDLPEDTELNAMTGFALDWEGNLYFRTFTTSSPRSYIISLSDEGILRWTFTSDDTIEFVNEIMIDGNNTLFLSDVSKIYAIDGGDGTLKWSGDIGMDVRSGSPMIGFDGSLYLMGGMLTVVR